MRGEQDARLLGRNGGAGARARGEREVRGNARFETRVYFRTGITRVVPWLVLSDSSRPQVGGELSLRGSFGVRTAVRFDPAGRTRSMSSLVGSRSVGADRVAVRLHDPCRCSWRRRSGTGLIAFCLELWDAACGRKVAAMFPFLAEWNGRVK